MSTEAAVRSAKTPQEAMVVLAKALDRIEAALAGSGNEWSAWEQPPAATWEDPTVSENERLEAIDAVKKKIADTTDPDDLRALQAKLRLLEDPGAVPINPVQEGIRPDIEYEDGMIVLPPPGVERKAARAEWLKSNGDALLGFYPPPSPMTMADLTVGYIQGGPLWLYYQDNQVINTMPVEWRRAFVDDIHEDSPAAAQEIARDILKDTDAEGARESAMEGLS